MATVANLFDVAMMFAVTLILALFAAMSIPGLLSSDADVTIVQNAGKDDMEILVKKGLRIERYRVTKEGVRGHGQRLGIAYQLPNGEVVYVPEGTTE